MLEALFVNILVLLIFIIYTWRQVKRINYLNKVIDQRDRDITQYKAKLESAQKAFRTIHLTIEETFLT